MGHFLMLSCTYLSLIPFCCRSSNEYVVSFEVWHEKLIQDAENYYEQKLEEDE